MVNPVLSKTNTQNNVDLIHQHRGYEDKYHLKLLTVYGRKWTFIEVCSGN